MKKIIILALVFLGFSTLIMAQSSILEARGKTLGTVVTVKGIVTNNGEFGPIRYFQDNTAGIAAYGSIVNTLNKGDSVTITGTLKNYNQLLELDPTTSVVVRSTGNPVPSPIELTISQIAEEYEAMLVKINNIQFSDAGGTFTGNKKYQFTSGSESGYFYVKTGQTDIVGQPIPSGVVSLTAILSQFDYTSPTAGYQLLPRTIGDIKQGSSIYFTSVLTNTSFTKTSLAFSWTTNITGSSQMFYGLTAATVKSNIVNGIDGSTSHSLSISGATAGQIIWTQAFSVTGTDTAFSGVIPFATISNSTGNMKVYFNTAVDNSVSKGVNAIYLPKTIDDTLINYINRAKYTIDLTMYNFNNTNISNISDALKAAAIRGVRVRVIGCGTTANLGMDELAGSAVHVLIGPSSSQRTGIMHNKFILFDTESSNANDPLVWTGSTNLTDDQINLDANNVIIIQDQSLARGYQIEFEEMWGSSGNEPNSANSRFGFTKKNNTPHEFLINGIRVENYFSPTDGVNARIVQTINTTNHDLSIATMLITRTEMADAIAAQKAQGDAVNVIMNAESTIPAVTATLTAALGTHLTYDNVMSGLLHHKYMIVDQGLTSSDPLVLTGSHNWSAAADNDNDENTLIIHDSTIANIYYQNFVKRFLDNNGVLTELNGSPTAVNDNVQTLTDQPITVLVLDNDKIQAPVTLSIETQPKNGTAFIPFTNPNAITYQPNASFSGNDSITYKIVYQASASLFATAKIYIKVAGNVGLTKRQGIEELLTFPNPVKNGHVNLSFSLPRAENGTLQLLDMSGKQIFESKVKLSSGENHLNYNFHDSFKGTYLLRLITTKAVWNQKIIFE